MTQEDPQVLTISTYPRLKKFVYKFYQIPKDQPVFMGVDNVIGIAMANSLKYKVKPHSHKIEQMTVKMDIVLSSKLTKMELRPAFLNSWSLIYDKFFKEFMCVWIYATKHSGLSASHAIREFLSFYNIKESEYSWDSAERQWRRHNNKEYSMLNFLLHNTSDFTP